MEGFFWFPGDTLIGDERFGVEDEAYNPGMNRAMIEIDGELLAALRLAAEEQGRAERELLEEAVRGYLRRESPDALEGVSDGRRSGSGKDGFVALLERMSGRFGLDEEEAMKIAVEEQHAWRRERREREGDPPS